MSRLNEQQVAALSSSMSDASVGMVLGRSVGWVARMRHDLASAEAPLPGPSRAEPSRAEPSRAEPSRKCVQSGAAVKRPGSEVVEALEEEFDLLCLERPSPWRIRQALDQAGIAS